VADNNNDHDAAVMGRRDVADLKNDEKAAATVGICMVMMVYSSSGTASNHQQGATSICNHQLIGSGITY
jgi:hypothetical protein